ncbi:hypothetical protein J4760_04040 [Salinicoccus sp. ID82-1]|uniref:hypothetical protein n=1 Tax=Salinicoccus sp. ID82-1 TaxID=2820269 RepID=UPI001F1E3950|nr:hypothetical protein [Salinicoccus sp. ID82-1]MCG1009222.1 hypothetical protein [Salinicoccus sp. ID82-1]
MIKEVQLTTINQRTGEEEGQPFNVIRARVFQYAILSKTIGGIITKIKQDPAIMDAVQYHFFGNVDENWMDKDSGELLETFKKKIEGDTMGAFGFALEHLPDELIQLVSAAANIKKSEVEMLTDESFFDLIEAVIEVNDINRLADLVKNFSSNLTKAWEKQKKQEDSQANLRSVTE